MAQAQHLYAPLPDSSGWRGDSRPASEVVDFFGSLLTDSSSGAKKVLETKLRKKALLLGEGTTGSGAPPPRKKKRRNTVGGTKATRARARDERVDELPTWKATLPLRTAWAAYAVKVVGFPERRGLGSGKAAAGLDLTGAVLEVCRTPNAKIIGAVGAVVDESASCLFLRTTANDLVRLPKRDAVFALHFDAGRESATGASNAPCLVLQGAAFQR